MRVVKLADHCGVNLPPERNLRADAVFLVFQVETLEIVGAQAKAVGRIEEIRLAEAGAVLGHLRAGRGLDAELLPAAAEGLAAGQLRHARRDVARCRSCAR